MAALTDDESRSDMARKSPVKRGQIGFFFLDFLMIILLVVNLAWIVFDWLFEYEMLRGYLYGIAPDFTEMYAASIHPRFILIDLMFVSVFLAEFFIRWAMAVYQRIYHRWFFFPFLHFYDLLGCIPVGGFRFLRLLRIISITYRLQKNGIIDLSDTAVVRFIRKYHGILIEELSDRVTINILTDIQREVQTGGPVVDRIVNEVVMPQRESLVEWMSHRIEKVANDNYDGYREDIREYVQERINTAVDENDEFARLELIPVFGSMVRSTVEKAIADMVFSVINGIMQDLASSRNRVLINEAADVLFDAILLKEEDTELNRLVVDTMDRSLEIVKQQVRVQQWKLRDLAEDEDHFRDLLREELMKADVDADAAKDADADTDTDPDADADAPADATVADDTVTRRDSDDRTDTPSKKS
ncbi:MAG: ion transporter [Balneolaceae bacterium]|nr:MAG: ion transporter [Balneolaceae bacterium]